MNKVTIVTITYNHEKFIRQTLDGFVNQKTDFDFEVIVSDDCSTDNTPKIITEYALKYPKIIKPILRKKNLGVIKNYIETLDAVSSGYMAYCEGDDYWTDMNKLQEQVDFLDNNPEYSICFHQNRIFFDDGSKADEIYPKSSFPKITEFEDLLKENYMPANTVMYRWQFSKGKKLSSVFPVDIVPCDYYLHLLHAKNGKIYFINKVMSSYRRHNDGMWWLVSQPGREDEFSLKYGVRYLNFFKAVENNFNLDEDVLLGHKLYLANDLIKAYMKHWMFDELIEFRKDNRKLFDKCKGSANIHYQKTMYDSLPRFKKIAYLMLIDPAKFKSKIKDKVKLTSKKIMKR